ncbi:magnesium transporter [Tundrisphaera lichenicola]|uniref:magnesium transporter n=1 Tax=Tundrisphaera lichenicola TaxID=2029860 RepID=UPI003EBE8942
MLRNPLLVPDLRELIQAGETSVLSEFLADHHPGHIAEIIEDLGDSEGDTALTLLPDRARAEVMSYVEPERQVRVVEAMAPSDAAALLHLMSHDDRAHLVNRLDDDRADDILRNLAQAEREDIRRLASYEPGTAGAVMTTDYATLPPHLSVREALDRLRREAPDRETIDYSYVVDDHHKLIGVVPLKRLILARPLAKVEQIMQRDMISARVDDDQEAVAQKVDKYDLFAIPILDASDMLVGIVTHDDAMDILRQEQTEDILAFGGVASDADDDEEGDYWQGQVQSSVRRRIGWLLLLFLGGSITRWVIHSFDWVDQRFAGELEFNAFIPLLIGTGGNAGSQTVGTIIRGLALGQIERGDLWRVIAREMLTGLILGLLLGTLGFVFTWLMLGQSAIFGLVIALAILGICVWANGIGALVPLMARRFGLDPALISAPLISTLVDTTGLVIFYGIAIVLLIHLAS